MFIVVYVTHATELAAKKVADYLLNKKLVACANIFPITSAYWWQEKITKESEWVSIVKTIPEKWDQLVEDIEAVHPYTTPCIMKFEVTANQAYENWIRDSVVKE